MQLKILIETINHVFDDDLNEFLFHYYGKQVSFSNYTLPIELLISKIVCDYDLYVIEQFVSGDTENIQCIGSLLISVINSLCIQGKITPGYYLIHRRIIQ